MTTAPETRRPAIIVSTFQRGGSSLLMQMIAAAGVPCLGTAPVFEDRASLDPSPEFLARCAGKAVKVLEPGRSLAGAEPIDAFGFWLDRDPQQRAKSAMRLLSPDRRGATERNSRRVLARSYRRDRDASLAALRRVCRRGVALVRFETLIVEPVISARGLAAIVTTLGFGAPDPARIAAVIEPRGPACTSVPLEPYLLELARSA